MSRKGRKIRFAHHVPRDTRKTKTSASAGLCHVAVQMACPVENFPKKFSLRGCGGRNRTCDLKVMGLAR